MLCTIYTSTVDEVAARSSKEAVWPTNGSKWHISRSKAATRNVSSPSSMENKQPNPPPPQEL